MILILLLVGLLFTCPILVKAQESEEQASRSATAEICQRLQQATVRIVSNNDRSSGVMVSAAGHILTVAHGLHGEGRRVAIVFHDGSRADGEILLRDKSLDVALLKLVDDSSRPSISWVSIAAAGRLQKMALVLAAGLPGREPDGFRPVVRLGELLAIEPATLRSSCTLTAGDSGGPLVNHHGELIGLHRQIGLSRESNHHLPLAKLEEVVKPVLDLRKLAGRETSADNSFPATRPSADPVVTVVIQQRSVRILQENSTLQRDTDPQILATLLDADHVVTKLSELTPNLPINCHFYEGDPCAAEIVASEVALDLAILKLKNPRSAVTSLASQPQVAAAEYSVVFAASDQNERIKVGLLTRCRHNEVGLSGKLGAVLEIDKSSRAVRVNDVSPNSTASLAGLSKNCLINSINNNPVMTLDDVGQLLREQQPGDWLQFKFLNGETSLITFARLQHDPAERFERMEFLDGRSGIVSERRSGFDGVMQHDIELSPADCGSPLVDSLGRVVGINIARRARESTLAIPLEVVLKLLKSE